MYTHPLKADFLWDKQISPLQFFFTFNISYFLSCKIKLERNSKWNKCIIVGLMLTHLNYSITFDSISDFFGAYQLIGYIYFFFLVWL